MTYLVQGENQVYLGGQVLTIAGRVQETRTTPLASKQTLGQSLYGSSLVADEFLQHDFRPGQLIREFNEQTHQGQYWFGIADPFARSSVGKLTKSRKWYNIGLPDSSYPAAEYAIPYGDYVYFSFGGKIHYWNHTNQEWSAEIVNVGTTVKNGIVFRGSLFLACGDYYYSCINGVWARHPESQEDADAADFKARAFIKYDASATLKLVKITDDGVMSASTDGLIWDTSVGGELSDVPIRNFVAGRNQADSPTPYISGNDGLYSVDLTTSQVYKTSLETVPTRRTGFGLTKWTDGLLYMSDNLALWKFPRSGQIQNIGLDREDGVIPELSEGFITKLIAHPNYIITAVDSNTSGVATGQDIYLTEEYFGSDFFPDYTDSTTAYSAIYLWDGTGWNCLKLKMNPLCVSSVYTEEVWLFATGMYGRGKDTYYCRLPVGNIDHTEDDEWEYDSSPDVHVSAWVDCGQPEIVKVLSSFIGRVKPESFAAPGNKIQLYYAVDGEETFTKVSEITSANIDSRGYFRFPLADNDGVDFRKFRYKLVIRQGETSELNGPCLYFIGARYKRYGESIYGYQFNVVSDDNERLVDIWKYLQDLNRNFTKLEFAYRTDEEIYTRVLVAGLSAIRYSTVHPTGFFSVNVLELEDMEAVETSPVFAVDEDGNAFTQSDYGILQTGDDGQPGMSSV